VHTFTIYRHVVQVIVLIALNAKLLGIASSKVIVPYLHATQGPFSTAVGAYESLEFTISKGLFPLLSLGVIYLTAISVGRVFCGWACPFGLVQDLLTYLPIKKYKKLTSATENSLKDVKWVVLIFSLFVSALVGLRRTVDPNDNPLDVMSDGPFSILSPSGTLFAYIPWVFLWKADIFENGGFYVWLKLIAFIAVIVPSLYIPRFFCRYICPLAPLLGGVAPYKVLRIYRNPSINVEQANGMLDSVCPTGVKVDPTENYLTSPNCISCGNCVVQHPNTFYPSQKQK